MQWDSAISVSIGQTVAPKCNLCPNCTCTYFYVFSNVLTPVELNTAPMGMKLGKYPRLSANRVCYKGIALSLPQSARRSPHFAIFAQHCTCTYFYVFSNVLPPVELNTAPIGMKLCSYPRLGANRLCYKGIALSLRQSGRRSPHCAIFAQIVPALYFTFFRKFCHLLSLILL